MIGCIRCHGPTDDDGLCPMCDWRKIDEKYKKAKGGDAVCPPTQLAAPAGNAANIVRPSNAAPTFNPKGRGTKHPSQRWAEVAMDFLKAGDIINAQISLQACIDSL